MRWSIIVPKGPHPEVLGDLISLEQSRTGLGSAARNGTSTIGSGPDVAHLSLGRSRTERTKLQIRKGAQRYRAQRTDATLAPALLCSSDRNVAVLEHGMQLETSAERFDVATDSRELRVLGPFDPRDILLADA
jgi:hypothetical protein